MALGVPEYPGAPGGVNVARLDALGRSRPQHAAEVVEVTPRPAAIVGRVGDSQVRHHALQVELRPLAELAEKGRAVLRRQPVAAHAGIDFEVHGIGESAAGGFAVQLVGVLAASDGGRQAVVDEGVDLLRPGRPQHQDRRPDTLFPQRGAFQAAGHAEPCGAARQGGLGQDGGTVAVGVGLDHGHDFAIRLQAVANGAEVVGKGIDVDLGHRRGCACWRAGRYAQRVAVPYPGFSRHANNRPDVRDCRSA